MNSGPGARRGLASPRPLAQLNFSLSSFRQLSSAASLRARRRGSGWRRMTLLAPPAPLWFIRRPRRRRVRRVRGEVGLRLDNCCISSFMVVPLSFARMRLDDIRSGNATCSHLRPIVFGLQLLFFFFCCFSSIQTVLLSFTDSIRPSSIWCSGQCFGREPAVTASKHCGEAAARPDVEAGNRSPDRWLGISLDAERMAGASVVYGLCFSR